MAKPSTLTAQLARELLLATVRNSWLLTAVAFLTTALIAATHLGTRERIAQQQKAARFNALVEIVPEASENKTLDQYTLEIQHPLLGYTEPKTLYQIQHNNQVAVVVFTVIVPDGYTGEIELLVGVARDGTLRGVRTISHRETPGLGDKVELRKSDWIKAFSGTRLGLPAVKDWAVKRDGGYFEQFTGATITPRAVVNAVRRALEYTASHHHILFSS